VQDESLIEEMRAVLKDDREHAEAQRDRRRTDTSRIGASPGCEPAEARRRSVFARLGWWGRKH